MKYAGNVEIGENGIAKTAINVLMEYLFLVSIVAQKVIAIVSDTSVFTFKEVRKNKMNDNSAFRKTSSLSPDDRKILRDQEIDENGPGTILRNFEILLNFIGTEGIKVSSKLNLLPIEVLPQLNAQLCHPIKSGLRRPQQKSYPHINGLYLLLRATGLACTEATEKKQFLVLDQAVIQSWRSLNATERYFTLLEGTMMTYLYDFGDRWGFDVKLERIDPVDPKITKPIILETHGESPEQYPRW